MSKPCTECTLGVYNARNPKNKLLIKIIKLISAKYIITMHVQHSIYELPSELKPTYSTLKTLYLLVTRLRSFHS